MGACNSMIPPSVIGTAPSVMKEVDSWIDFLDEKHNTSPNANNDLGVT